MVIIKSIILNDRYKIGIETKIINNKFKIDTYVLDMYSSNIIERCNNINTIKEKYDIKITC